MEHRDIARVVQAILGDMPQKGDTPEEFDIPLATPVLDCSVPRKNSLPLLGAEQSERSAPTAHARKHCPKATVHAWTF